MVMGTKRTVNLETKNQIHSKNNKNIFKIKCMFNEQGDNLENIIERAFGNHCKFKLD